MAGEVRVWDWGRGRGKWPSHERPEQLLSLGVKKSEGNKSSENHSGAWAVGEGAMCTVAFRAKISKNSMPVKPVTPGPA